MIDSNIDLKIKFFFGDVDGNTMNVDIQSNTFNSTVNSQPGAVYWNQSIKLPGVVKLHFSGKNMQSDTRLDELGNIVLDKHVRITGIWLDGFKISKMALEQAIILKTDQGELVNSYIGHNGIVVFDFDQPNIFLQLAKIERQKNT